MGQSPKLSHTSILRRCSKRGGGGRCDQWVGVTQRRRGPCGKYTGLRWFTSESISREQHGSEATPRGGPEHDNHCNETELGKATVYAVQRFARRLLRPSFVSRQQFKVKGSDAFAQCHRCGLCEN